MEFRSLEYFVQIADEGSISRAAGKLGVAQPALTRRIKQLETELGTQLLTRLPRGVRGLVQHDRGGGIEYSGGRQLLGDRGTAQQLRVVLRLGVQGR